MNERTSIGYRILALSATPGDTLETVQGLITNLHITKLKTYHEQDADLAKYMHKKQLEVIQVKSTDSIMTLEKHINAIIGEVIRPLLVNGVFTDWGLVNNPQRVSRM
jgi:ERCC4-related helicase